MLYFADYIKEQRRHKGKYFEICREKTMHRMHLLAVGKEVNSANK